MNNHDKNHKENLMKKYKEVESWWKKSRRPNIWKLKKSKRFPLKYSR
jgi:hypothetical protein